MRLELEFFSTVSPGPHSGRRWPHSYKCVACIQACVQVPAQELMGHETFDKSRSTFLSEVLELSQAAKGMARVLDSPTAPSSFSAQEEPPQGALPSTPGPSAGGWG